ncbi:hypothetical protein CAC42_5281 [Sphaceloma murrayae]|uniref:F-box domain-containing protein n=1 Tax=Sphaceloma murrayae TaxID=2082308 RepID=A0A2K1QUL7_9PEZI|nr:hypothetical protein CAC42_5281 [Sphaceloma murrayae]
MSRLLDCSHEVLHNILTLVEPADLSSLSLACRSLDTYIAGNVLLHKELYLQRWDPPRTPKDVSYPEALHAIVSLEKTLSSSSLPSKQARLSEVAPTVLSLLSVHSARNTAFLTKHFESQSNIDALIARSSLYVHAGTRSQTAAESYQDRQTAAKLHVYYGMPVDHAPPIACPYYHAANRPGYGNVRSPYHILYPRSQAAALNGYGDADAAAGAEEGDVSGTHAPHFLRSSVAVTVPANNIARAKVYDLREYTAASLWGPFKGDGSQEVDWEKMEAIMVLLGYNLREFAVKTRGLGGLWYGPWEGVAPDSFHEPDWGEGEDSITGISRLAARGEVLGHRPSTPDKDDFRSEEERQNDRRQRELDAADPYGVSGTWMRVVCFLDYNDLYAFNFTRPMDRQDSPGIDTREAIRLIKLKLKVTRIKYPSAAERDDSDSSSDFDDVNAAYDAGPSTPHDTPVRDSSDTKSHPYGHYPTVYFTGTSRSLHASWDPNANSRIRGTVRMTAHGDVRWTTWSIFHGEERWRSEGVQVGGPKSGRGVLGNWFDKDFDAQGPAGPTAFWKVSGFEIADEGQDGEERGIGGMLFDWGAEGDSEDDDDDDDEEEEEDEDEVGAEGGGGEGQGEGDGGNGEEGGEDAGDDSSMEGVGERGYADVEVIDEELMGVEFVVEDIRDDVVEGAEGGAA